MFRREWWQQLFDFGRTRRRLRREARAREAARREIKTWHLKVLETLIHDVLQTDVPFVYDAAFSWLFDRTASLEDPTARLDLFLPEVPLAIDVLGPEYSEVWSAAEPYVASREEWEAGQQRQTERERLLKQHRCPYLVIRHSEPVNRETLKERIKALTRHRYGG